jgi:poly(3-hydroxybutyrate) depolymerase
VGLLLNLFLTMGIRSLEWRGMPRSYVVYVPAGAAKPAPLLVLLHPSRGRGLRFLAYWRRMADAHGFVVVAPDSRDAHGWSGTEDGPDFIHQVIDKVAAEAPIDRRRIYLFGHSAGAHYALLLSLVDSETFAAAAVYAGAIEPDNQWLIERRKRTVPVGLWVGMEDRIVPPEVVRATQRILRERGVPAELHELRRRDHAYSPVAEEINEGIWRFLSTKMR